MDGGGMGRKGAERMEEKIWKVIRQAKRQLTLQKIGTKALRWFTAGAAIAAGLLFLSLFLPFYQSGFAAAGILFLSTAAGIFAAFVKRPDMKQAAREADATGLKERLTTAYERKEEKDLFSRMQREETMRMLEEYPLKERLKKRTDWKRIGYSAGFLCLALLFYLIPTPAKQKAQEDHALRLAKEAQKQELTERRQEREAFARELELPEETVSELGQMYSDALKESAAAESIPELKEIKDRLAKKEEQWLAEEQRRQLAEAGAGLENLAESLDQLAESLEKDAAGQERQEADGGTEEPSGGKEKAKQLSDAAKEAKQKAEQLSKLAKALNEASGKESLPLDESEREALEQLAEEAAKAAEEAAKAAEEAEQLAQDASEELDVAGREENTGQSGAQASGSGSAGGLSALAGKAKALSGTAGTLAAGIKGTKSLASAGSSAEGNKGTDAGGQKGSEKQNGSSSPAGNSPNGTSGEGSAGEAGNGGDGAGGQSGNGGNGTGGSGSNGGGSGGSGGGSGGGWNQGSGTGVEREHNSEWEEETVLLEGEVKDRESLTGSYQEGGTSYRAPGSTTGDGFAGTEVDYGSVVGEYSEKAYRQMEQNEIPSSMQDVVKNYFNGLQN